MKPVIDKVKEWDNTYGGLIRWILIVAFAVLLAVADSRYMKREEIDSYLMQLNEMREKDLTGIYDRIEVVRGEAQTSDNIVRKLESRLGRIEAQNEIILKRLERFGQ